MASRDDLDPSVSSRAGWVMLPRSVTEEWCHNWHLTMKTAGFQLLMVKIAFKMYMVETDIKINGDLSRSAFMFL